MKEMYQCKICGQWFVATDDDLWHLTNEICPVCLTEYANWGLADTHKVVSTESSRLVTPVIEYKSPFSIALKELEPFFVR